MTALVFDHGNDARLASYVEALGISVVRTSTMIETLAFLETRRHDVDVAIVLGDLLNETPLATKVLQTLAGLPVVVFGRADAGEPSRQATIINCAEPPQSPAQLAQVLERILAP